MTPRLINNHKSSLFNFFFFIKTKYFFPLLICLKKELFKTGFLKSFQNSYLVHSCRPKPAVCARFIFIPQLTPSRKLQGYLRAVLIIKNESVFRSNTQKRSRAIFFLAGGCNFAFSFNQTTYRCVYVHWTGKRDSYLLFPITPSNRRKKS